MAKGSESFLRRWARLKAERAKEEKPRIAPASVPEPAATTGSEPQPASPEELPSIDSLTKDSDFTAFLKAGVPEALRRLALRKLWRSDPVFANLDGLVEYGEDFGAPFRKPGPVATLFRLGRGMPGPSESEATEAEGVARPGTVAPAPAKGAENPPSAEPGKAAPQERTAESPDASPDDPNATG
ncbi:MAG: DUF3306 domain-containing protein [Dongiaceae bacterium]